MTHRALLGIGDVVLGSKTGGSLRDSIMMTILYSAFFPFPTSARVGFWAHPRQ